MNTYIIQYSTETRWVCCVEADGPDEAIEQFWLDENEGNHNEVETNSSGPQGLSLSDAAGNPIPIGERLDL